MTEDIAGPADQGSTWPIGRLARATGVSARMLRHFDEIGLLVPSARSAAGHRRYTAVDVRRLHQIVALRGFGLSLAEVARVLGGTGTDLMRLLRQQLHQVDEQIAAAARVRQRLRQVLGTVGETAEPPVHDIIALVEEMTSMRQPFTIEQLQHLTEDRRRKTERMSSKQQAELSRLRQRYAARLSPDDLAELHRHRAELLPVGWAAPGDSGSHPHGHG